MFQTFVLGLFFLFLPSFVLADIGQPTSNVNSEDWGTSPSSFEVMQTLGTGLSGTITYAEFAFGTTDSSCNFSLCPVVEVYLGVFNDASYGTGTSTIHVGTIRMSPNGVFIYAFGTSTPLNITLDPTKYYGFYFICQGNCQNVSTKYTGGSSADTYLNGSFYRDLRSLDLDSNVSDAYFFFQTSGGYTTNYSTISNQSPQTGSTTASTNVNFVFDYVNNNSASTYLISVQNMTGGNTFSLGGSVGASGTISRSTTLNSGSVYKWNVFLLGTNGEGVPQAGNSQQVFSVVTNFSSTTINATYLNDQQNYDTDGNIIFPSGLGTSTLGGVPSGLNALKLLGPIGDALCTRFPFSYLCDFGVVIMELNQTDTAAPVTIDFPLGARFTNPTGTTSATSFVFMDTSNIQSGGLVEQIRTIGDYGLWLMFGSLAFYRILKVF